MMYFHKAKDKGNSIDTGNGWRVNWSVQAISGLWQIVIDSWWIIKTEQALYGKMEEEQLAKMTKKVGDQIVQDINKIKGKCKTKNNLLPPSNRCTHMMPRPHLSKMTVG